MRLPVILLLGVLLALCGCGREAREKLVVYSAGPRPLAEKICRDFTAATGIPVELFSATTGQIMARIEAEKYRPRADIVILASRTAAEALKESGRLRPFSPSDPELLHPSWNDPEGLYHATAAACVGIAFRNSTWRDNLDWTDFLDGSYPGSLVMPSPTRSGTAGDFLLAWHQRWGSQTWKQFLQARQNGLQIVGANSQAITGLLSGAYDAVFAAADYIICREIERGEPVRVFFPKSGAPIITRPIAILSSTPHPENAEKFAAFCLGESAQKDAAAIHLIPARKNIPLSPIRARMGIPAEMPCDPATALAEQRELLRRFEYEIERAVILK